MVVAETLESAREAARKVHVSYDAQSASATFGSAGLTEEMPKRELPQAGDADAAYDAADVKLDARYSTPAQHHNAIELFTTTCAWRGDELTASKEPS